MLKIAHHVIYNHPLKEGHRFPMEKYDLLPQQLIYEGTCAEDNFFEPEIPNNKHFFTVHEPEYFFDLLNITLDQKAARRIGFPLSEVLIEREMIIADGTMKASEFALQHGIAMNIAGGTHHAFTNKGEAFCMLNDQAIGAKYTFSDGKVAAAGTMGEIGTTSFFPSKNLGCYGDGGAIYTNNDELATIMRSVVNHGMGERYYYERIGVNSRLDSIQAAILRIKLRNLDNYAAARNKAASYYDNFFKEFANVTTPVRSKNSTHVFHQYTLVIENLNQFEMQNYLQLKGVPAMIYYPVPIHTQNAYGPERFNHDDFPVTNKLCKTVISLPMHTELSEEQLLFICEAVKSYLTK